MALHWTSRRRVSWRLPAALLVLVATALASPGRVLAAPSARESADPKMQTVDRVLDGVALVIREAAKAGAEVEAQSEALLAKRLVDAQLLLEEGEAERAAIVFFDLSSNFASSAAGPEALVSLGEALAQLGMRRWAVECFVANLVDKRPAAKRFNQQSIARLLDLSAPRRELGFAERPGLSAMPETRGRLRSLGLPTTQAPLPGALSQDSATRLVGWVKLYPGDARTPELRYAYGRYLFAYFAVIMGFSGLETMFSQFNLQVLGLNQQSNTLVFAVVGLTLAVVQGGLIGRLTARYGSPGILRVGMVILALFTAAYGWQGYLPSGGLALLILIIIGSATGMSLTNPSVLGLISNLADPSKQGATMGITASAATLGRTLGPLVAGLLYARMGPPWPFTVGAALAVVALMLLPREA